MGHGDLGSCQGLQLFCVSFRLSFPPQVFARRTRVFMSIASTGRKIFNNPFAQWAHVPPELVGVTPCPQTDVYHSDFHFYCLDDHVSPSVFHDMGNQVRWTTGRSSHG